MTVDRSGETMTGKGAASPDLRDASRSFLTFAVSVVSLAVLAGALGILSRNAFLLQVHPYLFFTGFGNAAILILNRYLMAAIYPGLSIDPRRQLRFLAAVSAALVLVVLSVLVGQPLLKAAAGLLLLALVVQPLAELLGKLPLSVIWGNVSGRYYIFDVLFLLNANLGLLTLGIREAYPANGVIPFFVTQSAYFLGSSFPLSISVMGFLYTYVWRQSPKRELARQLFSLWFYLFIGGVLFFLLMILSGQYLGMMLVSHLLMLGVLVLLVTFGAFLNGYFRTRFAHPALAYLFGALAFLFATSAFGILNIFYGKGILFGSYPPILDDKMWIYHAHTHAALLGWITLSFTGMMYIVIPVIQKTGSLDLLENGDPLQQLLDRSTMSKAFVQLSILLLSAGGLIISIWLGRPDAVGICGLVYGAAIYQLRGNLMRDTSLGMRTRKAGNGGSESP